MATRRRASGEGAVHRRPDGRWQAALELPPKNGKRQRRYVYGKTRREALDKLAELQQRLAKGVRLATRKQTLGQYLEVWLRDTLPGSVRPSTEASYRDLTERHIIPAIGRLELERLAPSDVRAFLKSKSDEISPKTKRPLSARTVQLLHATLRRALEDAVRDELLARNVAKLVSGPRVRRDEIQPLSVDEAHRLLEAARRHRLRALWVVLLSFGLRRGEALALRWSDVDLERRVLRVRGSLQRLDGELRIVEPKTTRSARSLPLPDVVVEELRQHRAEQVRERLAAPVWVDDELVFTTHVGTALEPRNVLRDFQALCAAAGLRQLRIHDLRHAAASFLLLQGVDMRVIMGTLGHSRLSTTSDLYTHLLEPLQRAAADGMDALLRARDS